MSFFKIRDQIVADLNSTCMNHKNCSEAVWALRDIDEEYEYVKKYFEGIINACATGKVFDLIANKYIDSVVNQQANLQIKLTKIDTSILSKIIIFFLGSHH